MTTTPAQPAHGSERPAVLGDSALQSQTLESVASAVNYHDWLTSLTRPHLGDHPVELGSGLGDYAQRWLDLGRPAGHGHRGAIPSRLAGLHERFADEARVHVTTLDLTRPERADHSAFVMVNVLEHIPDDVGALRAAHSLVRPGGAVVVLVPAFSFAMSRFDRAVGHVRRYTVSSLTRAMTEAGLDVEDVRYVNLPGLPAWFLGMRLLRMTPGRRTVPVLLGRPGGPARPPLGGEAPAALRAVGPRRRPGGRPMTSTRSEPTSTPTANGNFVVDTGPRRRPAGRAGCRHADVRAVHRAAVPERGGDAGDLHPQGAAIAGVPGRRRRGRRRGQRIDRRLPGDRARRGGPRRRRCRARGYGAALHGGIEAARGRYVIMADADDSYALDDIGGFVDALRGRRRPGHGQPVPGRHRARRHAVRCTATWATRCSRGSAGCSSGSRSATSTAACAAFRRDRVLALGMRTEGMEFASEMVVRASLHGLRDQRGADARCARTGGAGRRICAPGGTAGGTCGSCSRSARAGCCCTRACA